MFKGFITIALLCFAVAGYSQIKPLDINKGEFKAAEPEILENANYILQHPVSQDDQSKIAIQNILRWMEGTPDYTFTLDGSIGKFIEKSPETLGIYMAGMTKYVLENPDMAKNQNEVTYNTFVILLDYAEKPANGISLSKDLKKAIDAKNNNKLREYLKIK